MIVVAGLAVVAVVVVMLGGRLSALASLPLRGRWSIVAALVVQGAVALGRNTFPHGVSATLHVASYAFAAWFLWANRRLPWLWVAAIGGGLNLVAIAANGGVMPASPAALRSAGMSASASGSGFTNSGVVAHAKLAFLGDVFAVPKGVPLANVFSVGDVVLLAGVALLTVSVCGVSRAAGGDIRSHRPSPRS